jgi:hypothetical protein
VTASWPQILANIWRFRIFLFSHPSRFEVVGWFIYLLIFLSMLRTKSRVFSMLGRCSTTEAHSQPHHFNFYFLTSNDVEYFCIFLSAHVNTCFWKGLLNCHPSLFFGGVSFYFDLLESFKVDQIF